MRKILLDFYSVMAPGEVQDYLMRVFDFPDYYGKNLDALYDMLTELCEYTCVGVFESEEWAGHEGFAEYLERVKRVLRDAEAVNPRFCVIFAKVEENETVQAVEESKEKQREG